MNCRVLFSAFLRLSWVNLLKSWSRLAVYWLKRARDSLIEGYFWSWVGWSICWISRGLRELDSWLKRSLDSLESGGTHLADFDNTLSVWILSFLGFIRLWFLYLFLVSWRLLSLRFSRSSAESEAAGVYLAAPTPEMITRVQVLLAPAWKELALMGGWVIWSHRSLRVLRRDA